MEYLLQTLDVFCSFFDYLKSTPQVAAALIASLVAIWGILSQRQLSRQKNSLDFEGAYKRNKEIAESNQKVIDYISKLQELPDQKPDNIANIVKVDLLDKVLPTDNEASIKALRHSVVLILNEWERAANAVFTGLYDEDYLYRAHGTSIIKMYTYLRAYIKARQDVAPRYYINFTRLALRWSLKRCKEDELDGASKALSQVLSSVQNAAVEFHGHKVTESHPGELKRISKAQNKIWLTVNKPKLLKRFLVFMMLAKH